MPDGISITWYGHATWGLAGPDGTTVLLDPWFTGPTRAEGAPRDPAGRRDRAHPRARRPHRRRARARRAPAGPVLAPTEVGDALEAAGVADVDRLRQGRHGREGRDPLHDDRGLAQRCGPARREGRRVLRAGRLRDHLRERHPRVCRGRHLDLLRHGADPRALRALHRDPADRRALHDGSVPGCPRMPAARRLARAARALRNVPGARRHARASCAASSPTLGLANRVQVHELEPGGTLA